MHTADLPDWRPVVVPGERIFLSLVRRDDVPQFARWFADLELTAYLGQFGSAFTLEQEQAWYDGLATSDQKTFAIMVREQEHLIGTVSLMRIDQRHGTAELGIAIGEKSAWGQGYGSEAVRLMADYGLTFLGLHTIYLWHTSFNERGHRAYVRAGFKLAGHLRDAVLLDGERCDKVLMDITREDLGPSRLRGLIGPLQAQQ